MHNHKFDMVDKQHVNILPPPALYHAVYTDMPQAYVLKFGGMGRWNVILAL